jgi:anti-anti-sigma factor
MELDAREGRTEILLPSVLDLPAAGELREALLDALARKTSSDLVLKAAGVERISTACVQVMLAAAASFQSVSRRLVVERPSAAVIETFKHLGLAADLESIS